MKYNADQQAAADYISKVTDGTVGGGDDPVGFLIASHAMLMQKIKPDALSDEMVLSISEAINRLGISRAKIYAEIMSGRLLARKIGSRTVIAVKDARAWLDALPPYKPTFARSPKR